MKNELLKKIKHNRVEHPLLYDMLHDINKIDINISGLKKYYIDDVCIFKAIGCDLYMNKSIIQLFFNSSMNAILFKIINNFFSLETDRLTLIYDDELTDIYYFLKDRYNLTIEYVFE